MNTVLSSQIDQILMSAHVQPAVSIILPFEPKMDAKYDIAHRLQNAVSAVECSLRTNTNQHFARLVIRKLNTLVKDLNFSTFRKSLAIYVSPVFEKVLYLDIEVNEKVMIDDSFEIRDIVYAKKEDRSFLLLVLEQQRNAVWLFNGISLILIQSVALMDYAAANDAADNVLSSLLRSYPLPVLVTGSEERLKQYKTSSIHSKNIVRYLFTTGDTASLKCLTEIISPVQRNWPGIRMKYIMNRIRSAAMNKQLVAGIRQCEVNAARNVRQLLVMEKNFMAPTNNTGSYPFSEDGYDHFSCVKDPADDLIEKVLSAGGDVEFVEDGILEAYGHLALLNK